MEAVLLAVVQVEEGGRGVPVLHGGPDEPLPHRLEIEMARHGERRAREVQLLLEPVRIAHPHRSRVGPRRAAGRASTQLVTFFLSPSKMSIGTGKMMVEFFSVAISVRVCR